MITALIPSFEQVPYNSIVNRVDNGSQCVNELLSLFTERKELEEKNVLYSAKVSRSNIYEFEINNSSCERVLGFFKNYHLFLYKAQLKTHKDFGDTIIKELEELKLNRSTNVNKHKINVQNCLRDVSIAEEALDKAKKAHLKGKTDLNTATEKLAVLDLAVNEHLKMVEDRKKEVSKENKFLMGRMLSAFEASPEQERDKQYKKRIRKENELNAFTQQIIEKKKNLMDKINAMDIALHKAAIAMQEAEIDRLNALRSSMKTFCEFERASIKARGEFLATLEEAVSSQVPDEDVLLFISQEKQIELTHKYTSAIKLMDRIYEQRDTPMPNSPLYDQTLKFSNDTTASAGAPYSNSPSPLLANTNKKYYGPLVLDDNQSGTELISSRQLVETEDNNDAVNENGNLLGINNINASNESGVTAVAGPYQLNAISKLSEALTTLFPITNVTTLDGTATGEGLAFTSVDDWRILLEIKEARELFLQELDEQRGRRSLLAPQAYKSLMNAMKVSLDYCELTNDVKSAMRIANMANTFHKRDDSRRKSSNRGIVEEINKIKSSSQEMEKYSTPSNQITSDTAASIQQNDNTDSKDTADDINHLTRGKSTESIIVSPSNYHRKYLQSERDLYQHSIWHKNGFWEEALQQGVSAQMSLTEPVQWDELSPDGLREAVIGVHNIVFGLLGSLAFTMHELKLNCKDVESHIIAMSRRAQLSEDQEHELIRSIHDIFGNKPTPLSSINLMKLLPVTKNLGSSSLSSLSNEFLPHKVPSTVLVGKVIALKEDRKIDVIVSDNNNNNNESKIIATESNKIDDESNDVKKNEIITESNVIVTSNPVPANNNIRLNDNNNKKIDNSEMVIMGTATIVTAANIEQQQVTPISPPRLNDNNNNNNNNNGNNTMNNSNNNASIRLNSIKSAFNSVVTLNSTTSINDNDDTDEDFALL
eukprot:gene10031-13488_t